MFSPSIFVIIMSLVEDRRALITISVEKILDTVHLFHVTQEVQTKHILSHISHSRGGQAELLKDSEFFVTSVKSFRSNWNQIL